MIVLPEAEKRTLFIPGDTPDPPGPALDSAASLRETRRPRASAIWEATQRFQIRS